MKPSSAVAFASLILVVLFAACSRSPTAPAFRRIEPPERLNSGKPQSASKQRFQIYFLRVPENAIDRSGLRPLCAAEFSNPAGGAPSVAVAPAPFVAVASDLDPMNPFVSLANSFTNILLATSTNAFAASTDREPAQRWLNLLTNSGLVELSGPLALDLLPDAEGLASVGNALTVMIGVRTNTGAISYAFSNLMFGASARVSYRPSSNEVLMDVACEFADFLGYKQPSQKLPVGSSPPVEWPEPRLDLALVCLSAKVRTNEALFLATEVRTNVAKRIRSIPILRELPTVGHFFRSARPETNVFRYITIVLVQ